MPRGKSNATPDPRPRPRPGFSLIELLVVISIVALLIALLLPALGQARAAARQAQCLANLRQVGLLILSYSNEYRGFGPYTWYMNTGTSSAVGEPTGPGAGWAYRTYSTAFPETRDFTTNNGAVWARYTGFVRTGNGRIFICPETYGGSGGNLMRTYYGNNRVLGMITKWAGPQYLWDPANPAVQLGAVVAPARKLLILERHDPSISFSNHAFDGNSNFTSPTGPAAAPHPNQQATYLYADGHAAPSNAVLNNTYFDPK